MSGPSRPPPPTIEPPSHRRAPDPVKPPAPDIAPPNVFSRRTSHPGKPVSKADPQLTRRRFVRLGLGGTALLGLGGLFAYQSSGYEVPSATAARLLILTPKEFLIVSAVSARILRRDADDLPLPEEVDAAFTIDRLVADLDAPNRTDLLRLLHALEHALPLSIGVPSRFTRASAEEQDALLLRMSTHEVGLLRGAFDALKSLCVMAYFSHPLTWDAIGYDGPMVARPAEGWVSAARLLRGAP